MAREDIIVFQKFDNLIEANIVKTKLDAYDIPCFLTEENLTHLTTHLLSGGIRLHIFKKDIERARHALAEVFLTKVENDELICPSCGSKKIFTHPAQQDQRNLNQHVVGFLLGLSRQYYCLDCGNEFDE